jgi:hypothetical protein
MKFRSITSTRVDVLGAEGGAGGAGAVDVRTGAVGTGTETGTKA